MDEASRVYDTHGVTSTPLPTAARNDELVDRATDAMQANPTKRWTVASLARLAGLSRAPFARRFTRATGTSPMRWLARHRLELAQMRLACGHETLGAIATSIGYTSEFALSKAFKRVFGVAPAVYRRIVASGRASVAPSVPRFRAAA